MMSAAPGQAVAARRAGRQGAHHRRRVRARGGGMPGGDPERAAAALRRIGGQDPKESKEVKPTSGAGVVNLGRSVDADAWIGERLNDLSEGRNAGDVARGRADMEDVRAGIEAEPPTPTASEVPVASSPRPSSPKEDKHLPLGVLVPLAWIVLAALPAGETAAMSHAQAQKLAVACLLLSMASGLVVCVVASVRGLDSPLGRGAKAFLTPHVGLPEAFKKPPE